MLLIAGGSYAAASGGGTIKACEHRGSHALYLGKCKKHDKKLSWGTAGPRGAAGLQGAKGDTGATGQVRATGSCSGTTGAIGSISATGAVTCNATLPNEFGADQSSGVTLTTSLQTIVTRSLPGGSPYLVSANVPVALANGTAGKSADAYCQLLDGSTVISADDVKSLDTPGLDVSTVPLELAVPPSTTATTVTLSCELGFFNATGSTGTVNSASLNAIQTESNG